MVAAMQFDLSGLKAIVTGSTGGISFATALSLAAAGTGYFHVRDFQNYSDNDTIFRMLRKFFELD